MNHSELIARLRTEHEKHMNGRLEALLTEAADALQALERVPMTEEQAYDLFGVMYQMPLIRSIEAHHGITPPESKG